MKLSNRMLNHLEKFGEYDTPKYRYYIGTNNGCEYVKRISCKAIWKRYQDYWKD